MRKLKKFSLDVTLRYDSGDLYATEEESSEFIMGLEKEICWKKAYDINEQLEDYPQQKLICQEELQFYLKGEWKDEKKMFPQDYFYLKIENIVAHSQHEAWNKVENSIQDVCKTLSIQINMHNCNKQNYQPRVQWDKDTISWYEVIYEPYEALLDKLEEPEEYIDENGKKYICFKTKVGIEMKVMTSHTLFGYLNENEFIRLMKLERDEKLNFLMEEYFIALGSEKMTSKFFHLFAIIEFTEKEYAKFADAEKILTDTEIDDIIESIKNVLNSSGNQSRQISSTLKGNMSKMTDIGRAQKLANMLNHLDISDIQVGGERIIINKENMQNLIELRNRYFHGDASKKNRKLLKIDMAVAELLEICLGIIQYKIADEKTEQAWQCTDRHTL